MEMLSSLRDGSPSPSAGSPRKGTRSPGLPPAAGASFSRPFLCDAYLSAAAGQGSAAQHSHCLAGEGEAVGHHGDHIGEQGVT